jgi:hypothetical protein
MVIFVPLFGTGDSEANTATDDSTVSAHVVFGQGSKYKDQNAPSTSKLLAASSTWQCPAQGGQGTAPDD